MVRIGLLSGLVTAVAAAQTTVVVLRPGPLLSPREIAALESRVLQNPDDLDGQRDLLQLYSSIALPPGHDDPVRQSVRLQHILYLVERHPEAAVSGSRAAYVGRARGAYANVADHEAVRDQWLAAVQGHPGSSAVTLNAVRFLEVEDPNDAEQVLRRAVDAEPENREIAANLGFLYAKEMLNANSAVHGNAELQQSFNPIVLAAAGTALPNLAVKSSSGRVVDQKIFELAEELAARARDLAPDDPDIQGPMPLIQYFAAAQMQALALIQK